MKAIIPVHPDALGGPFVTVESSGFEVLATRENKALLSFQSPPAETAWVDACELMYCQLQHDSETIKVLRAATDAERVEFRVPLWIQSEDVPDCCGRPMFFVGQLDDDRICTEAPHDAKYWWHDAASFYVFTCPECMACKAIGQQY